MDEAGPPLHILVMTDRDWTHPQAGGTGANLFGQVSRWVAWGHRVSVIACSYPGAKRFERVADGLELHRMGGRSTVFPRAIAAQARGLVPDADVVLEVVNGITFLTPLWLRTPRVTLVHHVHRDHYVEELGEAGKVAAYALETAPLRRLYRRSRFLTISKASARDLARHRIPLEQIEVGYLGVELEAFGADESQRASEPTLLYLGRLKRYKRIEVVLDVLEACPGAALDIAGEGDHRDELVAEIERRGLGERVRMHGHVSEEKKLELYRRAWVNMTASSAEGWCLTVMEAAASGTPSAALAVGGLPESIVDGQTGVLAHDADELVRRTRELMGDAALRRRLGQAAYDRAQEFTWDATARRTLEVLRAEYQHAADRGAPAGGRVTGAAAAVAARNPLTLASTTLLLARTAEAPARPAAAAVERPRGVERVRTLWRLFRREQTDPAPFYRLLAAEAVDDLERRHGSLAGKTILDLGCGPGFYTEAFRAAGANVIPVDNDPAEMEMIGARPEGALVADAGALPLEDESVDGAFCSNLLEHTPNTPDVIREIERTLRPGGWAYISWTNWYSPWGGHDMSPYHYLGPTLGPRLYEHRHGPPRKNPYGSGLWAVHIGPTLRLVRERPRLRVVHVEPRYWPRLAFLVRIPLLREIATWNCVIRAVKS